MACSSSLICLQLGVFGSNLRFYLAELNSFVCETEFVGDRVFMFCSFPNRPNLVRFRSVCLNLSGLDLEFGSLLIFCSVVLNWVR